MRNPIRRNRNIGKTQGGRVSNGRAFEKWSRNDFLYDIYSKISESETKWQIFEQNPSRGYIHPCKGSEYIDVLKQLPGNLTKDVKAIILPRISKNDARFGVEGKRRYSCILINPFPKNLEINWGVVLPSKATIRHYEPWCNRWEQKGNEWVQVWNLEEVRKYYQYHLFLHELGHINQPWFHSLRRREEFAENFALEWAHELGRL